MKRAETAGAGPRLVDAMDVRRLALPTALLVLAVVVGFFAPGIWTFVATFGVVQALLVMSAGMLFGRAGLLSLCPLGFAGISAWVILWFNVHLRLPFLIMLLIAALAAVPAGVLVGGLALRVRGVNLAIATLAFGVAVASIFNRHPFPGTLDAVSRPLRPIGFGSNRMYFLLSVAILVAVGLALEWYGRRRWGRAWRAVRHSERATAAAGLSVPRVKLSACMVSAAIAGVAGGILAGQLEGALDVRSFNPILSLTVVAAAVMFGAQSLSGAAAAGIFAAIIPEAFRRFGWAIEYPQILFGIGAIQVLSQGGGGISSTFPWRRPVRSTSPAPTVREPVAAEAVPAGKGEPVLQISELTVRYGSLAALSSVSVTVPAGTVVGVIGPNGAGKTTLIDAVCGFVDSYSGSIRLDGKPIDRLGATSRARVGLRRTFQQGRAIPELTVGDYVNLFVERPLSPAELDDLLGYFGLPPADEPIGFIDVGTRRLVEVAAAVASRPKVAFLDEPAAGLGGDESEMLARRIRGIPARFGCSVVMIEHHVELVVDVCSEVTVLDFGIVLTGGTPEAVLADPKVEAAYLGTDVGVLDDLVTERLAGTAVGDAGQEVADGRKAADGESAAAGAADTADEIAR